MASRSASAARSDQPATFFRPTRPFFVVLIVGLMLYYGCAVFAPSIIPYDGLGPLGRLTKYLQENHKTVFHVGYLLAWLIHIGEACLSIWLCKCKNVLSDLPLVLAEKAYFGSIGERSPTIGIQKKSCLCCSTHPVEHLS